jgi:hypothetical protein
VVGVRRTTVRRATICFAFLAFTAQGVAAQSLSPLSGPQSSSPTGVPQAPVGHRQPTAADLPPAVQKDEQPGAKPWPTSQSQPEAQSDTKSQTKRQTKSEIRRQAKAETQSQSRSARGRGGSGPPVLQVGPSCEAAGRGAVVLGRNKESCLADETAAQTTLKQNWTKYAAGDKTLCIGMESTGGPASYVELLSCLEINRDAREIQNADPLEADLTRSPATTGAASADGARHRRHR